MPPLEAMQASDVGTTNTMSRSLAEPVAIVGLSCQFPQGATDPESFWELLREGRTTMTKVPPERFNVDSYYHLDKDRTNSINARGGHFVQGYLSAFDAPFFSIPKIEAEALDPQQRGLLESTYHALENAGISMTSVLGSRTAVFVGSFTKEFDAIHLRDPDFQPRYMATGTGQAMLANRLSWFYDFKGPSITLDTACSSGLNAVHLACQSIRTGETTMAVVAGCNVILNPDCTSMPLANLNFLSPDSICYSFDHRANGYSRGEGFGTLILKSVSSALRDGDTIRALIRATGSNQDGKTPGITQPDKDAQARLIRDTYKSANLDPGVTMYFEAHGTGTQIGDVIEATAIKEVFRQYRNQDQPLVVGALKSNIGHLEGASGIASIIKTVYALENGLIPPNANFERVNENIPAKAWNIQFPTKCVTWPDDGVRRASINSFGYGGSNAHVVLDDAYHYLLKYALKGNHRTKSLASNKPTAYLNGIMPHEDEENGEYPGPNIDYNNLRTKGKPKLIVLTAADEGGIRRLGGVYEKHLRKLKINANGPKHELEWLSDFAFTLSSGRTRLPWRSFLVATDVASLARDFVKALPKPVRPPSGRQDIGFVFTGQGAVWHAMGKQLWNEPKFCESMEASEVCLRDLGCPWSLKEELMRDEAQTRVHTPEISQPVCTALQIALVDLLASWDIKPSAVIGHSSGEIAAAYSVGSLSHNSGIAVAYHRGRLATTLLNDAHRRQEGMIAVALSDTDVEALFPQISEESGFLCVACINSPNNTTVSGTRDAIEALKDILDGKQIFSRKLNIDIAYHSPSMNVIAGPYLESLNCLEPRSLSDAPLFYSSVTGSLLDPTITGKAEYWVSNLVSPVNFRDGILQMCSTTSTVWKTAAGKERPQSLIGNLLEIGPSEVLKRPISETIKDIPYHTLLSRGKKAYTTVYEALGSLWCAGASINIAAVNDNEDPHLLVDLPSYPFNKSNTYWHEGRLSKNHRFRPFPYHELLGSPALDFNPLEPKWRKFPNLVDSPWLPDHAFNGTALYPAAGMLAMAIEAGRLMAKGGRVIESYTIRDVSFSRALTLFNFDKGLETQFVLQPKASHNTKHSVCYDFRLCSFSDNEWQEHCHGTLIVSFESDPTQDEGGLDRGAAENTYKLRHKSVERQCKFPVDSQRMYANLRNFGYEFGPFFQTLHEVSFGLDGEASATIHMRDWCKKNDADRGPVQPHLVHPTALDGLLHLPIIGAGRGSWETIPIMVPTFLEEMWISNKFLDSEAVNSIRASSAGSVRGYREMEFDVAAVDTVSRKPLVSLAGLRTTEIDNVDNDAPGSHQMRKLCFKPDWKPYLPTMTSASIVKHFSEATQDLVAYSEEIVNMAECVCLYFMHSAKSEISICDSIDLEPHLKRYVDWMDEVSGNTTSLRLIEMPFFSKLIGDEQFREATFQKIVDAGADGELMVKVGRNLGSILTGRHDTLQFLTEGGLLREFYNSTTFHPNNAHVGAYVSLLSHQDPNISILEIGAGTGGTTAPALGTPLHGSPNDDQPGTNRFTSYAYTDISTGFFEEAKDRFRRFADRMTYSVLDIERDPLEQGYSAQYDLVIAGGVIHATADVKKTLQHCRSLLKPGGKLLLSEPSRTQSNRIAFIFGLLPGWWLATETDRQQSPLLSDAMWHDRLIEAGFTGNDICLRDYNDFRHACSVIVSTKAATVSKPSDLPPKPEVMIIVDAEVIEQQEFAYHLRTRIEEMYQAPARIISLSGISTYKESLENIFCINLTEYNKPFLKFLNAAALNDLKVLCSQPRWVLWVSRDRAGATNDPDLSLATGFGRVISSESATLKFVALSLEATIATSLAVDHIVQIFGHIRTSEPSSCEHEFRSQHGVLHVNRTTENAEWNTFVHEFTTPQEPKARLISDEPGRSLKLTVSSPGLLSSLHFLEEPRIDELLDHEVEVAVKAVGVNFKSVLIALGQLPDLSLGLECAGVITRVGRLVLDFSPGDRVCCMTPESFKTFARCPSDAAYKIPESTTFEVAAALPVVHSTAYYGLIHLANLRARDSVLINAAAGGVGQAAIQIARDIGATIYATVGSETKKQLIMDLYNIPEENIFSSRNSSFASGVKQATNGRGVNVVLNSLAGELLHQSVSCLAPLGRFVEIGKKDMFMRNDMSMAPFLRNIAFFSVDLIVLADQDPELMKEVFYKSMEFATNSSGNAGAPQPLHVFKGSEIEKAFRSLQSGAIAGKAIVQFNPDDQVLVIPNPKLNRLFDPSASYVIAGGFGGLGRSIARWMVSRGARHLMLLSRSGPTSQAALDLIIELEAKGAVLYAPCCDISDAAALESTMADHSTKMPPMKGCIQATMVVRDGLFENTTIENFNAAIAPKVQGSWNLHTILPKEINFYVLLSSAAGIIGNRGQSNYAAGNTYQDALARYRVSRGERCISVNVGLIVGVGYAAQSQQITDSLIANGLATVREFELLAFLEKCCDPRQPLPHPRDAQIITGLETPASMRARNLPEAYWMSKPMFRNLWQMDKSMATKSDAETDEIDHVRDLGASKTSHEAGLVVAEALKRKLAAALSMQPQDIDAEKPTHAYGVDSLVAVELRYWFIKQFKAHLTVFEVQRSVSIVELCTLVAFRSDHPQAWRDGDSVEKMA